MIRKRWLPLLLFFCLIQPQRAGCQETVPKTLAEVQKKVQGELDRLDAGLRQAAEGLGKSGLQGEAARSTLSGLCSEFLYAIDCAAVDAQGTMVTIEPAAYRGIQSMCLTRTRLPVPKQDIVSSHPEISWKG